MGLTIELVYPRIYQSGAIQILVRKVGTDILQAAIRSERVARTDHFLQQRSNLSPLLRDLPSQKTDENGHCVWYDLHWRCLLARGNHHFNTLRSSRRRNLGSAGWGLLVDAMPEIRVLGDRAGCLRHLHRRSHLCASHTNRHEAATIDETQGPNPRCLHDGFYVRGPW